MNVIVGQRGTGKTKKLIQDAAAVDGIIVCKNPEFIVNKMHAYGIVGLRVISVKEYLTPGNKSNSLYFIDNAEDLFEELGEEFGRISEATVCKD